MTDTFVNCELLKLGLAEIATYGQTLKLLDSLIECQREAINTQQAAVHRYLTLNTDFDIRGWELSPVRFDDKWRLAMRIMEGIVRDKDIITVLNGGLLYPLGGRDPVFCPKCLNEILPIGDTWI